MIPEILEDVGQMMAKGVGLGLFSLVWLDGLYETFIKGRTIVETFSKYEPLFLVGLGLVGVGYLIEIAQNTRKSE